MTVPEVNQRRREENERSEAFVRLAESHGYPLEYLDFMEEILVHATAFMNRRTSSPVWLEPFLPMQCGLVAAHWWLFASIPVMAAHLVVFWGLQP